MSSFRFATQLVMSLLVMFVVKSPYSVERRHLPSIIVLCLAMNGLNIGYFTAAIYLPLGELAALEMAGFLGFVTVISRCFLKEKIDWFKVCEIDFKKGIREAFPDIFFTIRFSNETEITTDCYGIFKVFLTCIFRHFALLCLSLVRV